MTQMRIAALIVAAGSGTRFGAAMPKTYQKLNSMPVLSHSLKRFSTHNRIAMTLCVIDKAHEDWYQAANADLNILPAIWGGATRKDSVQAGLEALAALPQPPTHVLIHDAARPGIENSIIDTVINALENGAKAVTPVIAVADTLRLGDDETMSDVIDRSGLRALQTPQGFDFEALRDAYAICDNAVTDETTVMSLAGHEIVAVPGSRANMKITYPEDLIMLEALLSQKRITLSGTGIDVHPLAAGGDKPFKLGGITIPCDYHLAGHSDADVVLHALCDAIYGTIGDGDIGVHFPPSNMDLKDADSKIFLAHALQKLNIADGRLLNVDVTVLAEKPRLTPHRDAIRQSLATLCGLPLQRIGLKATTTEKMGFVGRAEGVLAQVTVTVELPDVL